MIGTALVGIGKSIAATRGQQVVGLLLTTIPLAERMLLYNFAVTALLLQSGTRAVPRTRWDTTLKARLSLLNQPKSARP